MPPSSVGRIIGRGGETIQRLQAESGARIDIKKEVMTMNDNMIDMPIHNKGELTVDIMIDQLNRMKSITQSMKMVMIISITIHHHARDNGVHLIKW